MLPERELRDFSRLFELIRQRNLAEQAATCARSPTPVDPRDADAFLARAERSLSRQP